MPSFDIISQIDLQEADNAINQARKEIDGRYDFKGSNAEVKWDKKEIIILGDDDYKMDAMKNILQTKFHKRGIDIKVLNFEKIEPAGGKMLKQKILLKQGIDREMAKEILNNIKGSKLKVQGQVMDDKVRVTSKSIDELQATMDLIRSGAYKLPLQFENMRS